MRVRLALAASILLLSVSAPAPLSGQRRPKSESAPPAAKQESAETSPAVSLPVDPKAYIIGAGDILLIRVWREPELSGPVTVTVEGSITLPLIGQAQAQGLTPQQLATRLTEMLGKYINRPEVLVFLQAVNSKRYYVSGEVNRPGQFSLIAPTTVLEALVNAGGLKEFANKKKIVIMRGDKRFFFNYKDVVRGKKLEQNILLEHGDHVIVE